MTERKKSTSEQNHCQHELGHLKDEVYRHMFRLEAKRPGSDMDLAISLLRAWTASVSRSSQGRQWLKKICPICLLMIEAARQSNNTENSCVQ
jgi:hypothetical protein